MAAESGSRLGKSVTFSRWVCRQRPEARACPPHPPTRCTPCQVGTGCKRSKQAAWSHIISLNSPGHPACAAAGSTMHSPLPTPTPLVARSCSAPSHHPGQRPAVVPALDAEAQASRTLKLSVKMRCASLNSGVEKERRGSSFLRISSSCSAGKGAQPPPPPPRATWSDHSDCMHSMQLPAFFTCARSSSMSAC